jgi:Transposase DDE domain
MKLDPAENAPLLAPVLDIPLPLERAPTLAPDELRRRQLGAHTVDNVDKARQVIAWYSLRWNIEQLFRTLKSQGLDVESSMLEDGTALERLVMLGIVAATKTMQLVLARDPTTPALPVERVFDQQEIAVIKALQPRLEGRTEKQRNPHQAGTLGWGSWTIARLGGWTGYASERPPGPITMHNGLQRFVAMVEGASLSSELPNNMCAHVSSFGRGSATDSNSTEPKESCKRP